LYTKVGRLRDQLANGVPKSHMGNPGQDRIERGTRLLMLNISLENPLTTTNSHATVQMRYDQ